MTPEVDEKRTVLYAKDIHQMNLVLGKFLQKSGAGTVLLVDDDTLTDELLRKQEFANYLVTQMCFDADAIGTWLHRVRQRGVQLPAWLGLPGVADRASLLKTSMRIGVGDSLRYLKRNPRLAAKLMLTNEYRPDELILALAPYLADSSYGIKGHHVFCFNQVERTEQWRHDFLERAS